MQYDIVFQGYVGIILSASMKKGIKLFKYSQDQSNIMLLFEHKFGHNNVVFTVTLQIIMLRFSSIIYVTLSCSLHCRKLLW